MDWRLRIPSRRDLFKRRGRLRKVFNTTPSWTLSDSAMPNGTFDAPDVLDVSASQGSTSTIIAQPPARGAKDNGPRRAPSTVNGSGLRATGSMKVVRWQFVVDSYEWNMVLRQLIHKLAFFLDGSMATRRLLEPPL
jgi:hypothetical protein